MTRTLAVVEVARPLRGLELEAVQRGLQLRLFTERADDATAAQGDVDALSPLPEQRPPDMRTHTGVAAVEGV